MKKIVIIAIVTLSFVASNAIADSYFYIGGKAGRVNYDFTGVSNNNQGGAGLLAGYAISNFFSVEAEFNELGGFESDTGIIKGSASSFNGVGYLPLNREFSLFGKMGITTSSLEDSPKPGSTGNFTFTKTGLNIGFGGQFNTEIIGIRFGFDSYPVANSDTTKTSSANMMYVAGILKF